MSFVGIIKCSNGILGFGDSRSTIIDNFGFPLIDPTKPYRQKVFINKKCILISYGFNTFLEGARLHYLEDWLNENINQFDEPFDLMIKFSEELRETGDNRDFRFLIGYHDEKKTYRQEFMISSERIDFSRKMVDENGYICNNVFHYTQWLNELIRHIGYGTVEYM